MKSTPGWGNHVNVGGPQDNQRGNHRPRVLGYETGLGEARDYLGEVFLKRGQYLGNAGHWFRRQMNWLARKHNDQPRDDENQIEMAAGNA